MGLSSVLILLSPQLIPPVPSSFKLSYISHFQSRWAISCSYLGTSKGCKRTGERTLAFSQCLALYCQNIPLATKRSPWEKPHMVKHWDRNAQAAQEQRQCGNSAHKMLTAWVHRFVVKLHQASGEPVSADIFQCLTLWLFFRGSQMVHSLLYEQPPKVKLRVQRTVFLVYNWKKLFSMCYVFSSSSMSDRFDPFQFKNQPRAYSQHGEFSVNSEKAAKL